MALVGKDLVRLISKKRDRHRLNHLQSRLSFLARNVELILTGRIFPIDRKKESDLDAADDGAMGIEWTRAIPARAGLRRFF